jgi:hypothetical protein
MIWETAAITPPKSPTNGRETLVEEVLSLCVSAGELDTFELRELAVGVAWHAAGLARRPAVTGDLSRLTARALSSLGRPEAARRVLVLGSGLVQASRWLAVHPGTVWTLDLPRLLHRKGDHLELALFRGLDLILDTLAGLWDASDGEGVLGLRRSAEAARLLLGPATPAARLCALRNELRDACDIRLDILGAARGWTARPRVLFTDPEPLSPA